MTTTTYLILAAVFVLWNLITFALYGRDKRKAEKDKRRISEATLLTCAFLMGALGALFGMRVFRHKTKHLSFKILVPLALVVNVAAVFGVYWLGSFLLRG
ncbi:MAG: DUF1294 domain-containing protein [Oscillospiraceae bacterium]|nr:DUF1294 domain-containing protein [Oscillospiraceae bacterium]